MCCLSPCAILLSWEQNVLKNIVYVFVQLCDAIGFSLFPCHCTCCWWHLNTCRFSKSPSINICVQFHFDTSASPLATSWPACNRTAFQQDWFIYPVVGLHYATRYATRKTAINANVKSLSTSWIWEWVLLTSHMHSSSRNAPLQEQFWFSSTMSRCREFHEY